MEKQKKLERNGEEHNGEKYGARSFLGIEWMERKDGLEGNNVHNALKNYKVKMRSRIQNQIGKTSLWDGNIHIRPPKN